MTSRWVSTLALVSACATTSGPLTREAETCTSFAEFDARTRERLETLVAEAPGDVLVKEGQTSDGLYVVLSGEVEIDAQGKRIATLKEGEVFGEMSLLTRSPASATVRAMRRTSLLRLPKQDFDTLILSHPQVLEHVSVLIDSRQRADVQRQNEMV
jgi:CRP-like cAMP-binding protein